MSNELLIQTALVAGFGLFSFTLGYLVSKFGLSTLIKDVENLKIQSPVTVSTPAPVA